MQFHKFFSQNKKVFLLSTLCLLLLKCTTDIDLEADWKPIPVVYGIIDVQDTAHYFRIEKVFQTSGEDAEDIAQIADSIYYAEEELEVMLEKGDNGISVTLERVDGNLEGYERTEGPFVNTPNILYKVRANQIRLDGGDEVKLILDLGVLEEDVVATTTVLEELTLSNTNPSSPINTGYERSVRMAWLSGDAVALHDLEWHIHYRERENNGIWEDKTIIWNIAGQITDTPGSNQETFTVRGRAFYEFLARELNTDPFLERQFTGIDIVVLALGEEFEEIQRINNANLGITSFQTENRFSNVEGGIGVLTSRTSGIRENLQLTTASLDSLKEGVITRQLNFR